MLYFDLIRCPSMFTTVRWLIPSMTRPIRDIIQWNWPDDTVWFLLWMSGGYYQFRWHWISFSDLELLMLVNRPRTALLIPGYQQWLDCLSNRNWHFMAYSMPKSANRNQTNNVWGGISEWCFQESKTDGWILDKIVCFVIEKYLFWKIWVGCWMLLNEERSIFYERTTDFGTKKTRVVE
jgi:hypothetical protein